MTKKNSDETNGLRERTHDSVDNIINKAESMKKSGKKMVAHAKERVIIVGEDVDEYIRKNPKKTVLYAAGAGVAAGVITTAAIMRRNHKNQSKICSERGLNGS